MSYTVLARRYRSRSFDEVVGQEGIARTLKNAVERDRLAHAYLFCGTRGVGKTSMARILAKAINAPGDEPREVAEAIMQGRDTDVIEIDAASNNKVEEARELIANCVYRPMRGRKKIYIIDEVHMLTTHAFNALLKTMEEPPDHVVFILCTTETHKVPPTIQSRCQRFDFHNIPAARIAEHLGEIVRREEIEAEPGLLHAVARLGNGSMRDALSLLDRVAASGARPLTVGLLHELLGLPDTQLVSALVDAMASSDAGEALRRADELLQRAVSPEQVLASLAQHLREVMVLRACGAESELAPPDAELRAVLLKQGESFDVAGLMHMIAVCESVQRSVRTAGSPRALFDAAIVRLAMSEKVADVTALLAATERGRGSNGSVRRSAPAKKR